MNDSTPNRIRHVKCDEAKPACLKCTSTGRKCDGYDDDSQTIGNIKLLRRNELEGSHTRGLSAIMRHTLATLSPSLFSWDTGSYELRALQFFQIYTTSQLSGYFASDIWSRYVLQLSLHEPSLFYAAIALGGLNVWYATGMSSDFAGVEAFTLQQYNKAISHLTKSDKPLSPVVVLLACYVFSSFEALYGNYVSAFGHVASGISLLKSNGSLRYQSAQESALSLSPSCDEEQLRDVLHHHFSRLDLLAAAFDRDWVPRTADPMPPIKPLLSFSSLEQARDLLNSLVLRVLAFNQDEASTYDKTGSVANGIAVRRDQLREALTQWSSAMEVWLRRAGNGLDSQKLRGSKLLKVHHATGWIKLLVPPSPAEMLYDQFLPQFVSVISLTPDLLAFSASPEADADVWREFSVEMGIVPALYLTGLKCRDPVIRRKAQALLRSSRRKEGLMESLMVAKMVERVVAIEEGGRAVTCCGDVPEAARLRDTWLHPPGNTDRDAVVTFGRQREGVTDLCDIETIEERISW